MKGIILGTLLLMTGQYIPTGSRAPSLNPCLVSAWPMNEGSGLTLHDVSGNSNNATISSAGNLTWTSNAIKSGVTSPVWSGLGGAVSTSTTLANFSNTHAFAFSVWIKGVTTTGTETSFINTLATGSNFQGWEIEKQSSSDTQPNDFSAILINNVNTPNFIQLGSTTTITDSALHYLVASYNGSSTAAGVTMYVDGVSTATSVFSDNLSATIASGIPVWIAQRNDGTDPMIGAMAYAEVYNCALTSGQVAAYYAAGPGIY